jgi:UDP-GlcNAc:undecaprenyl-phosphate GlcNAc-1-phosphate transferase
LVALTALLIVAIYAEETAVAQELSLLTVVVGAFLPFNICFPGRVRALAFMGDAGSMFLGACLAWFLITLCQGEHRAMHPVTALWIFAVPLFDTLGSMFRRLLHGCSPFAADRLHMHYLLHHAGLSVAQSVWTILIIAALLASIGVLGLHHGGPESLVFYSIVALFGVYFGCMMYVCRPVRSGSEDRAYRSGLA